MKRGLNFFIIIILIIFTFAIPRIVQIRNNNIKNNIENKLIRFHVIANSDNDKDQRLKLQVKDEIIQYMNYKLKNAKNINDSRNIIKDNDKKVQEIACRVIKNKGYNYTVKTTLSKEYFPVKTYGNITLPQGRYEAYRVIIGKGEGHNWWCVMFPPLCFVDVTKGDVSYKETENNMKKVLTSEEYNSIDNVKFKSKIAEVVNDISNKNSRN